MMDVGVRELKQRLSAYLDRAERGEIIRVTDRGRPKAVLGPLPGRVRLEEGVSRGVGYAGLWRSARANSSRARGQKRARRARGGPRRVTLYTDSSALLKRYVDESGSVAADELLRSDPVLATGRHTVVERGPPQPLASTRRARAAHRQECLCQRPRRARDRRARFHHVRGSGHGRRGHRRANARRASSCGSPTPRRRGASVPDLRRPPGASGAVAGIHGAGGLATSPG